MLYNFNYSLINVVTIEYNMRLSSLSKYNYNITRISNLDFEEPLQNIPYAYPISGWRDKLLSYKDQAFEYDTLGNPTKYRNKKLEWSHGKQLDKYSKVNEDNIEIPVASYTYNANGIRTSKTYYTDNSCQCETETNTCSCNDSACFNTQFFLNGNKIISQHDCCNDLTFYYGVEGIMGFHIKSTNASYDDQPLNHNFYYKKNLQGDIIGIIDSKGEEIIKYVYDNWGNHKAFDAKTNEPLDITKFESYTKISNIVQFIAIKNPFRYRSYYYDFETGLYYLNSRYYDPELGRFVNSDDINLINPYINNGINLYSYCYNNPNYFIDNSGMIPENYKLTSHFTKFHQIWQLIKDSTIGAIIGNLSITTSIIETGDPSLLYTYSSFGYDTIQEGVGINININKQIGIEGYYTIGNSWTDISVGFNSQAGPFSIGVSIGGSGIGFGFGLTFKNTAVDLSINIGWGTIALAGATFLSIAAIPVPGMRVIATIASFFILIFG